MDHSKALATLTRFAEEYRDIAALAEQLRELGDVDKRLEAARRDLQTALTAKAQADSELAQAVEDKAKAQGEAKHTREAASKSAGEATKRAEEMAVTLVLEANKEAAAIKANAQTEASRITSEAKAQAKQAKDAEAEARARVVTAQDELREVNERLNLMKQALGAMQR